MDLLGDADHVGEGRLFGIEVEDAPIRFLHGGNAARPNVQWNGAEVRDVEQRIEVVADEILDLAIGGGLHSGIAEDALGAQPIWSKSWRVLLIKRFSVNTIGISRHYQSAIA